MVDNKIFLTCGNSEAFQDADRFLSGKGSRTIGTLNAPAARKVLRHQDIGLLITAEPAVLNLTLKAPNKAP